MACTTFTNNNPAHATTTPTTTPFLYLFTGVRRRKSSVFFQMVYTLASFSQFLLRGESSMSNSNTMRASTTLISA